MCTFLASKNYPQSKIRAILSDNATLHARQTRPKRQAKKICQTYFKIGQTYFELGQTYFFQGAGNFFAPFSSGLRSIRNAPVIMSALQIRAQPRATTY